MGDSLQTFLRNDESAASACDTLVEAGLELIRATRSTRTVLDTFDGRLHAAGMRLELWDDGVLELVLVQQGSPAVRVRVDQVPQTSADVPAGPFRSRLATVLEDRALLARITLVARHTLAEAVDADDKTVVRAVVLDEILLPDNPEINVPWSLEVTTMAGYPEPAAQLVGVLTEQGYIEIAGDTVDLAMAACGVDPTGAPSSPTVRLDPAVAAIDGYRTVLGHLLDTIIGNLAGAADDLDPDFLHDLRIAVRRTRSLLASAKHVVPPDVRRRFRQGFRDLQRVTGTPRDLDVYVLGWDDLVATLPPDVVASLEPVAEHLRDERARAHVELSAALRGPETVALLDEWRTWLTVGPPSGGDEQPRDAAEPLGAIAAARILATQAELLDDGRAIVDDSPPEDLHQLRKDAKQLRYLVECFGGLVPPDLVSACTKRLKVIQENLGEFQDGHVQSEFLAGAAPVLADRGVPTRTLVAIGRLTAELERRSDEARAEFADRFERYDRPSTEGRFEKLTQAMLP